MSRSDEALVFIHGWPDTERLWDSQVHALEGRYRCVRFTLPGFERGSNRAYSVDAVVAHIHRVVDEACPGERVTLVLHDWGCVLGYAFASRFPERVARIVAADIGDVGSRRHRAELGIAARLMTAAYQIFLAAAWRIGGPVGDAMSRLFARLVHAPAAAEEVHAGMAYPYAVVWFGVAGGPPRGGFRPPAVPMLFVYGERKPFMFHSRAWARDLAARPGCRVVGLPAGHWMMVSCAEAFNSTVMTWLEDAC